MVLLAGSGNQGPTKYRSTTQYEQFLKTNRGPARNMSDGDRTGVKRAKLEGKVPRDTMSEGDQSEAELSLLRVVPPCPNTEYEEAKALERVANEEPENIRSYLYERAITLAHNSGCEHGDELETWTHENRERVTTCGRLRAEHVSGVNLEVCERILPFLLRSGTRSP